MFFVISCDIQMHEEVVGNCCIKRFPTTSILLLSVKTYFVTRLLFHLLLPFGESSSGNWITVLSPLFFSRIQPCAIFSSSFISSG